jgi:hemin uptake protein HemP
MDRSAPSILLSNERMPPKKPIAGSVVLRQMGPGPTTSTSPPDITPNRAIDVRYRVDELLKGGREAILVHRGQEYRLRITATGKLILTK